MKKIRFLLLIILFSVFTNSYCQQMGYPDRSPDLDVLPGFKNPPKGYGEVPFYWWVGDKLTKEKLTDHLDQLMGNSITSLQINYCHTDKGGLAWGLTAPSEPALFSNEWWELFGWFMNEAKKREMTVSLSDYTLGVGQGACMDRALEENPELSGTELTAIYVRFNKELETQLPESPLLVAVYKLDALGKPIPSSKENKTSSFTGKTIKWSSPDDSEKLAVIVTPQPKKNSYDPMNSFSGTSYVKHFFQQFEDRFPETSVGGLNFFFSDELDFQLKGIIWNNDFAEEFKNRKGYDIVSHLSALFIDEGDQTPKIRMDYNEVMVTLSEENFFEPVYNWHAERGLIFGCDHGGRGKQVDEFGDYFRTQRWNQGPGCDQSALEKDVIKTKVASSIAHMYDRPRTWLEGFYGSGWGTNTSDLTDALYANYAMGHNLMSFHGLYYSTVGGWWEWAPPCNHFRMPYWEEMKPLMRSIERMSYLFSQGYHRADIALLYPVEPVVAGYGTQSTELSFAIANKLYGAGIDFDFIDYESVARAQTDRNLLKVSGEEFRVLVLPDMQAIKHSTLVKALEFKRAGGVIVFCGELPEASERKGRCEEVAELVAKILKQEKQDKGVAVHLYNETEVLEFINNAFTRDFKVVSPSNQDIAPYVLHRKVGKKEFYAVYDVPKGSECFFRVKGKVELWDPWTGHVSDLKIVRRDTEGTFIKMPLDRKEMQIIMFDPQEEALVEESIETHKAVELALLDEVWEFEIIPVLDNRFGDYHWPASPERIGAEVREMKYLRTSEDHTFYSMDYDDRAWNTERVGFAPVFHLAEGISEALDQEGLAELIQNPEFWKPYRMSWRWGVLNDYGHQGYHGLKAEMYDEFIRLGNVQVTNTEMKRTANPRGNHYYMTTHVYAPQDGEYRVEYGEVRPVYMLLNGEKTSTSDSTVVLKKGANSILFHFDRHCTTYLVFRDCSKSDTFVEGSNKNKPLAMKWDGDWSVLPYDTAVNAADQKGWYRFLSAPGLEEMEIKTYGTEIKAWVNEIECEVDFIHEREDGLKTLRVKLKNRASKPAQVALCLRGDALGYYGGMSIPEPIKQQCGTGEIRIGDWSEIDGLKCYSGGALYRKNILLTKPVGQERIFLDLGEVISTARVFVNGKEIGLRITSPWEYDITEYIETGENQIEVKVFNTAANHYVTVPTVYRGDITSGILGPVRLRIENRKQTETFISEKRA